MVDPVPREKAVGTKLGGLHLFFALAALAEIHDRWKSRSLEKLAEGLQSFFLAEFIAEQNDIVASPRKLVWQVSAHDRVVVGDNGVRPVSGYVMREQSTEGCLSVNDHDFDVHGVGRAAVPCQALVGLIHHYEVQAAALLLIL